MGRGCGGDVAGARSGGWIIAVADFSAEWLSLREPADHLARSATLARAAIERSARKNRLRILDLAAGTGSNLRYLTKLAVRAEATTEFLLVDHDPALLAQVAKAPEVATR